MKTALVALVLIAAARADAQIPDSVDPGLIPNYVVVKPGLAGAGRPTPQGLEQLKGQGFRTVVDLSAPGEKGQAEEKALVEGQGLRYVSVPVTAATFGAADVDAVQAVLADQTAGPVLLHCASANRVGAMWAVLLAREGKPIDDAIADGRRVGLRSDAMVEAARRVAGGPPAQ